MNAGVLPTPNKATRGSRGGLYLHRKEIIVDRALGVWKYKDDSTVVSDDEYWIPQKANRPPDDSFLHKPTDTRYREGYKVWFEPKYSRWVTLNPEYAFVEDAAFQSPYFISGTEKQLPDNLRPSLEVSPLATPKPKSTAFSSTGTYRVTDSESESEPSDKEPDQQLEDSSDQVSESVLSPLTELSLVAQGKLREELDPIEEQTKQDKSSDPFDEEFKDAEDKPEEIPDSPEDPGSPIPPDSPITDPPTMATPNSLLGSCPTFKGKRKSAKEFISNIEIYFEMNPLRITTDKTKILLALQNISEDAQQWKENEKTDLDDTANVDKDYNNWTGFKTRFLKNWEEIDSSGNAYSELLKLNKRRNYHGKKRSSIIKYTERFKELIRKAGIDNTNAIYQYSQGLTPDEYRSIALTNPTNLQGWYDAAHRLYNINSRLGNLSGNTRSEWDMDVDVISVNAMSREERERHVRNNLCFICHKDGHVSKECPDRKPYKGGSKSGKYKGKYKKGKRFAKGHRIQAAEMDNSSEEEEEIKESSQSNEEVIRALIKKLPKDKQINMLVNHIEQDF